MFEVAADDVAGELFESAFDRWFEQALGAPGEGLRRLLRRREGFDREGPRPIIRAAAWELLQWRDFHAPWSHRPFDRDPEIDALVEDIRALGALIARADPPVDQEDWLGKALGEIVHPIDEATRLETRARARLRCARGGAAGAAARQRRALAMEGMGREFRALPRAEVMARRDALTARLDGFATRRRQPGAASARRVMADRWLLRRAKKRAGVLDFMDLLLVARDLVRDRAAVRAELQHRYQPHLRRRIPGHRSAAGGDPAAARGRRSRGIRLASRAAAARQAVYRRRSEAIDLSLPPRRRRALPGDQAAPARARGAELRTL